MDYKKYLAECTKTMNASAIRELFKVLGKEGMISLAGGAPSNDLLPVSEIKNINKDIFEKFGIRLLQYGTTEGLPELRKSLVSLLNKRGINCNENEVAVSTGAQTAIACISKILINNGDNIIIEAPSFLASINGFKSLGANILNAPIENDGLNIDKLEELLLKNKIKFLYCIPNFQNPSGTTLSLDKRKRIIDLAKKHDFLILEDDPYYELRYDGEHITTLKQLCPERVIYVGSLSKTFAPGMRLGFYVAPTPIQILITTTRQAIDVHANNYAQALASIYIDEGYLDKNVETGIKTYKEKRDLMLQAIDKYFPENFNYFKPEGGMFLWVTAPKEYNAKELQQKCLSENVAFVPGKPFFADDNEGSNCFRLNFTNVDINDIEKAISIIARNI